MPWPSGIDGVNIEASMEYFGDSLFVIIAILILTAMILIFMRSTLRFLILWILYTVGLVLLVVTGTVLGYWIGDGNFEFALEATHQYFTEPEPSVLFVILLMSIPAGIIAWRKR